VALLLRAAPAPSTLPFVEDLLSRPEPLQLALTQLGRPAAGVLDESLPVVREVLRACQALACLARAVALRGGACEADQAWCAGLLAPLGWLGVCALAPESAAACLAEPAARRDPRATQARLWGADQAGLARRLATAWELPDWLTGVLGRLDLPPAHARRFGVPAGLFSVVRLAVLAARDAQIDLGLLGPDVCPAEDEAAAGVPLSALGVQDLLAGGPAGGPPGRPSPYHESLLPALLASAIDNRRLRQAPLVARLEQEIDGLHAALGEQVGGEAGRLRSAKLTALAELAAGAGHEINNPLAVISGQAQYLLGHPDFFTAEGDAATRKALQTIVGQTKRIHGILRDLMQFARPAPPKPAVFDLPTLLGETVAGLAELAALKRVRLEVCCRPERLAVCADGEQVRTALACLLRNAVEASPADGWARLVLPEPALPDRVEVFVEDAGAGPAEEQRPHLFDPFYSGRSAGRGRGMGLPVAWRLARLQGGSIELEPARPGAPTRFVFALPRPAAPADRKAA
jgi:signal transduction histidine kinase